MGGAIGTVFFLVFVGVCGFIYWGVFYATKDKFENDEFKLKFLEETYSAAYFLPAAIKPKSEYLKKIPKEIQIE